MPSLKIAVPHSLPPQEAKNRIQNLVQDLKSNSKGNVSDVHESWDGETGTFDFKAMGLSVAGHLYVEDNQVRLEANLPFAALPFKGRIEKEIEERAKTLLA